MTEIEYYERILVKLDYIGQEDFALYPDELTVLKGLITNKIYNMTHGAGKPQGSIKQEYFDKYDNILSIYKERLERQGNKNKKAIECDLAEEYKCSERRIRQILKEFKELLTRESDRQETQYNTAITLLIERGYNKKEAQKKLNKIADSRADTYREQSERVHQELLRKFVNGTLDLEAIRSRTPPDIFDNFITYLEEEATLRKLEA